MTNLFSEARRKPPDQAQPKAQVTHADRAEHERDFDRILFSAPVRRLADKTQVFPLDPHDGVRTRLTHSHEVANLARSFGLTLVDKHKAFTHVGAIRGVPALLAACGLAHDLGNPPFGHQGEEAIKEWFELNGKSLENIDNKYASDFRSFDGNAQTFRLVTRLQVVADPYGLNLTYGTLAALMKYPTTTSSISDDKAATKKGGVFQSELHIAHEVWKETGLGLGARHPCAYVVEACDDIAYSVLDVEDSIKKRLTSFGDLMLYLEHVKLKPSGDDSRDIKQAASIRSVRDLALKSFAKNSAASLSPAELDDVSMQMFRVHAIDIMIDSVKQVFIDNREKIMSGEFSSSLLDASDCSGLCDALKKFAKFRAYRHHSVVVKELSARRKILDVMTGLWDVVKKLDKEHPTPASAADRYVYSLISENYRRVYEEDVQAETHPLAYHRLQLITDMVSGMTDTFLSKLHHDIESVRAARA